MTLRALIDACIAEKVGDKEFALFYAPAPNSKDWRADIGNPSSHVGLGEIEGEISASGDTPEEATSNLLKAIREAN